jgi:hypothetical protein
MIIYKIGWKAPLSKSSIKLKEGKAMWVSLLEMKGDGPKVRSLTAGSFNFGTASLEPCPINNLYTPMHVHILSTKDVQFLINIINSTRKYTP